MAVSFRTYIEEKYMDLIFDRLKWFVYNNRNTIPFRLHRIDTVHQAWLEDAYFKHFYVHDYYDDYIGMSIIVETEVTLKQTKGGDTYDDYDYSWFLVKCKCKFGEKITDFQIIYVEHYDGLEKEGLSLTDNLIPYIKKEKLDDLATSILKDVYPSALTTDAVDPYVFASRLGLTVKEVKFKNPNQMGKIYFDECRIKDSKGNIKVTPANTIKVSKDSKLLGFDYSVNFTIMHECVHFLLHRRAFQLERLFNKKAKTIECHNDGSGNTDSNSTEIDWMEWQANSLAPRLLMPAIPFRKKVDELFEKYKLAYESNDSLQFYEQIMFDLATYYGAPVESVKIRLIELGYEFPLGCFITVDDKPVLPHAFSNGSLARNETFSIGAADAAIYSFTEKYINNNNLIDGYIFVDSHLCINHFKYVSKNKLGHITLTDYARHHMDECCIKFEIDVPKKIGHCDLNYRTFKMLNRRKGNHAELVIKAYKCFEIAANKNNIELLKDALAKEDELLLKIPRTPNGVFKILKDYSGYTKEELLNISGLSKSTLDDYLYTDNHTYTLKNVVKLLLAMNIPHKVSEVVLQLCRCEPDLGNEEHQWIDFVLRNRWRHSLEENIKFLNSLKVYI